MMHDANSFYSIYIIPGGEQLFQQAAVISATRFRMGFYLLGNNNCLSLFFFSRNIFFLYLHVQWTPVRQTGNVFLLTEHLFF